MSRYDTKFQSEVQDAIKECNDFVEEIMSRREITREDAEKLFFALKMAEQKRAKGE